MKNGERMKDHNTRRKCCSERFVVCVCARVGFGKIQEPSVRLALINLRLYYQRFCYPGAFLPYIFTLLFPSLPLLILYFNSLYQG